MVRFDCLDTTTAQLPPSNAKITILQIENNQANAELVNQLIARRIDLKLLTATNGIQGIEMARTFQPAIILIDMVMPQMNGIECLALLRGYAETSHIPVLILSSNAFPGIDKKCLAAGAFAFLTKPYKIEDLLASIDAGLTYVAEMQ